MQERKLKMIMVLVVMVIVVTWLLPIVDSGEAETSLSSGGTVENCRLPGDSWNPHITEGFCRCFIVDSEESETLLVVPEGKSLVLLKCYAYVEFGEGSAPWKLTVDDKFFIDGWFGWLIMEDGFPDGCVVINAGETLKVVRGSAGDLMRITLVGYFRNVP